MRFIRIVVNDVCLCTVPLEFLQHAGSVDHNRKRLNSVERILLDKGVQRIMRQDFKGNQPSTVPVGWLGGVCLECAVEQTNGGGLTRSNPAPLSLGVLWKEQGLVFVESRFGMFSAVSIERFVAVGGDQTPIGERKVGDGAHEVFPGQSFKGTCACSKAWTVATLRKVEGATPNPLSMC